MATTLDLILDATRRTLPALRHRRAALEREAADAAVPPPFGAALRREAVAVVAEVKRRSPSAGAINEALDPAEQAARYAAGGAAAISVLTDGPHFGGSVADLRAAAARVGVPLLRKDFILAEEQIVEARAAGAAAVLLIVRALAPARLRALLSAAHGAGLEALIEVHDRRELDIALGAGGGIVGVNSRDLDTFEIDVAAAWALLRAVPADCVAVAESGMATRADVERAAGFGADAVLIGTALSRADDPAALLGSLAGVSRRGR